ncbi:hypothetical protein [Nocardia sp. X0981]
MSDANHPHLSARRPGDLVDSHDELTAVRDRLSELGAADVATEVDEIITAITTYRDTVQRQLDKLDEVLRALDALAGGDGDEAAVHEAVTRYRAGVD